MSRLLADFDEALREVRDLGQQKRGRVIVAASPTIACRLMPHVIAACLEQFSLVTLSLRDDVQSDVLRKVKSGEVDFGVMIGPFSSDELYGQPVMSDSFLPCRAARSSARSRSRGAVGSVCGRTARDARLRIRQPSDHRRRDACAWRRGARGAGTRPFGDGVRAGGGGRRRERAAWLALLLPADSSLVALPLAPRAERTVKLVRRRDRSLSPAAESGWSLIAVLPGRAEEQG